MQISLLIHNLESVDLDFFILYDIKIHHAKFHNSTLKCSDPLIWAAKQMYYLIFN